MVPTTWDADDAASALLGRLLRPFRDGLADPRAHIELRCADMGP